MLLRGRAILSAAFLVLGAIPVGAQVPGPAASKPASLAEDPLGRTTPRGAVTEFLHAAGDHGDATAAEYLEVGGRPADPSSRNAVRLAQHLKAVLDSTPSVHLGEISNRPEGILDDGLPEDRERIGTVSTTNGKVDLLLRRVQVPKQGQVWLFSAETLQAVPSLYADLAPPEIEQFLPATLVTHKLFDIPIWRWLALLILLPLSFGVASLVTMIAVRIGNSVARRTPIRIDDHVMPILPGPLRLFLAVCLFVAGMLALDLPLLLRHALGQASLVLAIIALAWFAVRLIDIASNEARAALVRNQRAAAVSIVPLGRRVVKVLAISFAVLIVLDNAGFDLKTVLTGLGIGGIAIAFAAQKTLENVFGAFSLVLDQPARVGDFCKFGDNLGTIEDIGLRSTRVRTLDRTIICVPNATFSTMSIENFGPREKFWFHPSVTLRLDTTADQARYILAAMRDLLAGHPKVEKGHHVRLSGFGKGAMTLDTFAYISTADNDEFLSIQEELLLRMMQIIEDSGTSIAIPSQPGYLTRSVDDDAQRARTAIEQVREREHGRGAA